MGVAARAAREPDALGYVVAGGRPPHSRLPAQHLGEVVPPPLLRCRSVDVSLGLRRGPAAGPRGAAADPRRRLQLVSAARELRVLREIADEVGATFMVDMAHFAGLVAGKVLTGDYDPMPYAHIVTTQPTRPCAVRAAASCCARTRGVRGPRLSAGTGRSHFLMSWPPRPSRWPKRHSRRSGSTRRRSSTTRGSSPKRWWRWVPVVTGGTDNHLVLIDVRGSA